MLRSLSLSNFRAFKTAHLEFSTLNIFVGPNNSGKSSIISAVNLIAQNVKREASATGSGLSLNGAYAELGTYYDVVFGHKANSNMKIELEVGRYTFEYQFRYRIQRREIELSKAIVGDRSNFYVFQAKKDSVSHTVYSGKTQRTHPLTKVRPRINGLMFYLPFSLMLSEQATPDETDALDAARTLLRGMSQLAGQFEVFDSVGAFRAPPQRTYLYSGETPTEVGRAGENFAQIIASSAASRERTEQAMVQRVNKWFLGAGIARDIQMRGLTNRHFELQVEDRLGLASNIVDVGFGCSQVLPVIIGGYKLLARRTRRRDAIYVVQEPEIHLHPNAAAHLGTFFCDLARSGVQCFVETHSENLVLRVARHVASGHIPPSDIRIFWVDDRSGERTVTQLQFRDDGSFEIDWPDGFFPTRSIETLELARAAANIPSADQLELTFDE